VTLSVFGHHGRLVVLPTHYGNCVTIDGKVLYRHELKASELKKQ